jgi:glycosyltransferase involved in cell wall biosynthesis
MKIAIVVHGRFHAFDLARELIRSGHDVCLVTNYPKRIAARFGIPESCVRTNLLHGVASRVAQKIDSLFHSKFFEPVMHQWFGRWAARVVVHQGFDIIHGFSGVYQETLRVKRSTALKTLVRGSAHIETQYDLLAGEEERAGLKIDKPSKWIRMRESSEYELADLIFVLSSFAWQSFADRGVKVEKLRLLSLGTDCSRFRAHPKDIAQRSMRIDSGGRLRILTVGTFSHRKGAIDLVRVAEALAPVADFRFVGAIAPDAEGLVPRARKVIQFVDKVAQFDLPLQYKWGDLFFFPTLEDGFAAVLAQAAAAGLLILATKNCAAPDIIIDGAKGWIFPIRRPDMFIEKIRWCNQRRGQLVQMIEQGYQQYRPRDWADVAGDFVAACAEARRGNLMEEQNVA